MTLTWRPFAKGAAAPLSNGIPMRVSIAFLLTFPFLVSVTLGQNTEWKLEHMVRHDAKRKRTFASKPFAENAEHLIRKWPEKLEAEFQGRARQMIDAQSKSKLRGANTFFENEKRGYGFLMAQALGHHGLEAVKKLQVEDAQAKSWHKHTEGIDYYACFTLKHQVRKYFYFGDLLDQDYRERMYRGAKLWTERDPMRRPHHSFEKGKVGWGPDARNSWVDIRSTENLFLMRNTSVYLMAEETKNETTRLQYKKRLLAYADTLFEIGIGEWDSENYHGHSIGPLLNLYDFADDLEVKTAARDALDWYMAAGALKYWRGGFTGPTKRDYNHAQPFGGSAAAMLWMYFGGNRNHPGHWESDEVHIVTSSYRPPVEVVEIANRKFLRPATMYATKPEYSATTSLRSDSLPAYLETMYFGQTFQMGSLAGGTRPGKTDVNGFKILAHSNSRGSVTIQAAPTNDARFVGSPMYQEKKTEFENRIAQFDNAIVWLCKNGQAPWKFVVPDEWETVSRETYTFLKGDKTWIALIPIGLTQVEKNESDTRAITEGKKARFPGHYVLSAKGKAENYCGVGIIVGDKSSEQSFETFAAKVRSADLDSSKLDQGIVQLKLSKSQWLGFHWNDDPHDLGVWKNGKRHDWKQHARYLYRFQESGKKQMAAPVFAERGQRRLVLFGKTIKR